MTTTNDDRNQIPPLGANSNKETLFEVIEIFDSICGEVNGYDGIGQVSTFIRLATCNLKCRWCDTLCAQVPMNSQHFSLETLLTNVTSAHVTITGGEPLLQQSAVVELVGMLCEQGHQVTIETNGSIIPSAELLALPCVLMMDFKLPSSQMMPMMSPAAFKVLRPEDWVKFVCADPFDFQHAILALESWDIGANHIAFSPCLGSEVDLGIAKELCVTMLEYLDSSAEKRRLHFSLQIHKLLGVR